MELVYFRHQEVLCRIVMLAKTTLVVSIFVLYSNLLRVVSMSRIGKKLIKLPTGVEVKVTGNLVSVKGPKGQLERELHPAVCVEKDGDTLHVKPVKDDEQTRKFHGLSRTLLNNMVIGCSEGFTKTLSLIGVGYRAAVDGNTLNLTLGFSHPVSYPETPGIEFKVEKNTTIFISGASKEVVGEVAAKIRSLRPPEPYHGKGVRYSDEVIQTKVGKAAGKK